MTTEMSHEGRDPVHNGAMDQLDHSPVLASAAVVLGFAVLLSTFATDSPWPAILGILLVVAGGLWAGFSSPPATITNTETAVPDPDIEDERDDGHTA